MYLDLKIQFVLYNLKTTHNYNFKVHVLFFYTKLLGFKLDSMDPHI